MSALTDRELAAVERAESLMVFADAFEDAGHPNVAARARVAARDVLDLAHALEGERSARVAIQDTRDRLLGMLREANR